MSDRIRKTEHAGAKNGGGYWGKRHEAKKLSNKIRRAQSRQLEDMEVTEFQSSDQADEKGKRDEKKNEEWASQLWVRVSLTNGASRTDGIPEYSGR
jgi:hypothetical protein